jgi:hypothetical protein
LKDPLLKKAEIDKQGGYLKYWHNLSTTCPRLSQMALDYCSAPGQFLSQYFPFDVTDFIAASSVDAERAFSIGRCQVNFMQHGMNSQTFKAKMGVGSWRTAPFWPGMPAVAKMIKDN